MSDPEPKTITKRELVQRIAERTAQTKVVVKDILQHFLDEIIGELARGNRIEFREFGVFEVRERSARKAQNPRTLQKVQVPARRVVKFKIGRMMRERVCAGEDDNGDDYVDEPEELETPEPRASVPIPKPLPPVPPPKPPLPPTSNSPF